MEKYVLFGSGGIGRAVFNWLGKENVSFFWDNSREKNNTFIDDVPIYLFSENTDKYQNETIIVSVSEKYENEIVSDLKSKGFDNYVLFADLFAKLAGKRVTDSASNLEIYQRAISWVITNTVPNEGIINNTGLRKSYPEVSGYFIPTLIKWGYRDIALSYAKWLCSIQREDGAWLDTDGKAPYVFDTAQILKGLIAVRNFFPEADEHIRRGCDWILSNMQPDGRLTTPCYDAWGEKSHCDEIIHLYCLKPLLDAADIFNFSRYREAALKILDYYKKNNYDQIMNFILLSHFYAYVMEALVDLGEKEMASEAMKKLERYVDELGYVPAYNNVEWICSTGLFQMALVWFRLGNAEYGNKSFEYACKLQNISGGWFGGYPAGSEKGKVTYFPLSEISWAVKYFLDALYYRSVCEFEAQSWWFLSYLSESDERLELLKSITCEKDNSRILDLGCGKGRYVERLISFNENNDYYAVDISVNVLKYLKNSKIIKSIGSLTCVPYKDDFFDVVYTCEAMCHCIDVEAAVREMARVTKPGGKIVIIDKNVQMLGKMVIGKWEQWFDIDGLKKLMMKYCSDVQVTENISYENSMQDGLFCAWVGTVSDE